MHKTMEHPHETIVKTKIDESNQTLPVFIFPTKLLRFKNSFVMQNNLTFD